MAEKFNQVQKATVIGLEKLESPYPSLSKPSVLVNLRKEQRLNTRFAAKVVNEHEAEEFVVVDNLSASGLRISTFWQVIRDLIPDPKDPHPIVLHIAFSLPTGAGELEKVCLTGRPVYTRLVTEENYQVGISVTDFKEGEVALLEFLEDHGISQCS